MLLLFECDLVNHITARSLFFVPQHITTVGKPYAMLIAVSMSDGDGNVWYEFCVRTGLEQPCNPGGDFFLDDWGDFKNVSIFLPHVADHAHLLHLRQGTVALPKGFESRRENLKNPMSERSYTTVPMRVSSTKVSVASSIARLLRPFGGRMKSCFASILSFFSGGIAISYTTGRR